MDLFGEATVNLTYTAEEFEFRGELLTLVLDLDFTCSPFDPGNTYGPPECCYPPEGGDVEDVTATVRSGTDGDGQPLSAETLAAVQAEVDRLLKTGGPFCERVEAACAEHAAEAGYEPDYDPYEPAETW